MSFIQNPKQQEKDLKFYILEGITWAVMHYIGMIFLVPFLIILGAKAFEIGLIYSLPLFISSFAILFSYKVLKYFKSEKHFVLFFIFLQALFWIPLAFIGYVLNKHSVVWIVILIYTFIVFFEQFSMGVYRDWIGKIFNISKIVEINARKQIILNLFSIIPLLLAGLILDSFNKNSIVGFSIIFIITAISRFFSVFIMSKMSQTENKEKLIQESKEKSMPIFKSVKNILFRNKNFLYFLIIIFFIFFNMYLATPYYRYYFLEILQFSYMQYVLLEIGSILGLVLSFYYWGKICDKYGSTKVLKAIILFLPLYPFFVIVFGKNAILLFLLNVYDGVLMAGLTLGVFGYIYQNIKSDLVNHMGFLLIFQSGAMLFGTLVGGYITSSPSLWYKGIEKNAFFLIFIISFVFRILTIAFIKKIKDTNKAKINLPKSILLQKPIIFGLNQFFYISKKKSKSLKKNLKKERKALRKELIKQSQKIEKNIKILIQKEKDIFERIANLEKL